MLLSVSIWKICHWKLLIPGNLAPEYVVQGQLIRKADVYSFGVPVLEVLSGRSSSTASWSEIEKYLLEWRLAVLLRSRTVDTFKAEHEHNDLGKDKASHQAQEDGIGSSKECIPRDEAASPAKFAKAYMTSRPSKVSPSVVYNLHAA